jgi:4a-hydroxytetrahydrobiopterin dehydratase
LQREYARLTYGVGGSNLTVGLLSLAGNDPPANMFSLEELATRKSVERKGVPPMSQREAGQFLRVLQGWTQANGSIEKEFRFRSYLDGLDFAYSVGKIAEEQDHHPDILIKWKRVKLTLSTHSVKGLSENDFIVAAKSELKYRESGLSESMFAGT